MLMSAGFKGPEAGVSRIFEHARNNAPCILVIEDIDSMVTPAVRSFFLNELDGLVSGKNSHSGDLHLYAHSLG
jgi:SpoVK/Ycf46/Vps4 family AAA+-type ATPase